MLSRKIVPEEANLLTVTLLCGTPFQIKVVVRGKKILSGGSFGTQLQFRRNSLAKSAAVWVADLAKHFLLPTGSPLHRVFPYIWLLLLLITIL